MERRTGIAVDAVQRVGSYLQVQDEEGCRHLLRVTAELANLRSGPSDANTVRSQVQQGEELIELAREGNWRGVRVMRTGEEGWIFADLVDRGSRR